MRNLGAVFVRINNPVLLKILKEYADICPDVGCFVETNAYDFEYGDLFYSPSPGKCPETLDDLQEYILDLINEFADDSFDEFAEGFKDRYEEIKRGFSYVQWVYTPPANNHDMLNDMVFTYGKDKTHYDAPKTTLKVRILSDAPSGSLACLFRDDLFDYFCDEFEDKPGFMTWYEDYRYRDNPEKEVDLEDGSWNTVDIFICYRFQKHVHIDIINRVISKLRRDYGYHITCEY